MLVFLCLSCTQPVSIFVAVLYPVLLAVYYQVITDPHVSWGCSYIGVVQTNATIISQAGIRISGVQSESKSIGWYPYKRPSLARRRPMNRPQYSMLLGALVAVPDQCLARGKQLEWSLILGVIAVGVVSQQQSAAAIANWVHAHAADLLAAFHLRRQRLTSEATLHWAFRQIDVPQWEQHLASLRCDLPMTPPRAAIPTRGAAIDGNVSGAGLARSPGAGAGTNPRVMQHHGSPAPARRHRPNCVRGASDRRPGRPEVRHRWHPQHWCPHDHD